MNNKRLSRSIAFGAFFAIGIVLLLAATGCSKRSDLKYSSRESEWKGQFQFPNSPFAGKTFGIQIPGDGKPLRPDETQLLQRVIASLPELMPEITKQLANYDTDLKDPKKMKDEIKDPSICMFEEKENPRHTWAFVLERPAKGDNFGYHLEFDEKKFKEIWAGD